MKFHEQDGFFAELYKTKQGVVRAAVRSGLGTMPTGYDVDIDALVGDAWVSVLNKLSSFERRTDNETTAWLRQIARIVGLNARRKYFKRLQAASVYQTDMVRQMPHSYATTREDLAETSNKPQNAGDDES